MTKKIYFHPFDSLYSDSYAEAIWKLSNPMCYEVHTSQMSLLNRAYDEGFDVYILDEDNYTYFKVKSGESTPSGKMLREGHNIHKMWMAGSFGAEFLPEIKND